MRSVKRLLKLRGMAIAGVLLISGIGLIAAGFIRAGQADVIREQGIFTTGSVVGVDSGEVIVRYSVRGEEFEASTYPETWADYKVGQGVAIRALPGNPERFIIEGTTQAFGSSLLLLVAGGLMFVSGVWVGSRTAIDQTSNGHLPRVGWVGERHGA